MATPCAAIRLAVAGFHTRPDLEPGFCQFAVLSCYAPKRVLAMTRKKELERAESLIEPFG